MSSAWAGASNGVAVRTSRLLAPLMVLAGLAAGCSAAPDEDASAGRGFREAIGTDARDLPAPGVRPLFPKTSFTEPAAPPPVSAYAHLDPQHVVPRALLERAVAYFDANKATIPNQSYVTVVDFRPHSREKRFFVIDMKTGAVRAHVTAHGKMSDPEFTGYATAFSNEPESNKSSLGFAITGETYSGSHGRSLRLEGLSPTNDNMFDRAIVIHSASYVVEGSDKQGRSLGCFVLDEEVKDDIVDLIEGGSLFYADQS